MGAYVNTILIMTDIIGVCLEWTWGICLFCGVTVAFHYYLNRLYMYMSLVLSHNWMTIEADLDDDILNAISRSSSSSSSGTVGTIGKMSERHFSI